MGKTRTANAGVSIFKTESHVVEYKKRKSSEISIYDHGVQRGAPQPLTGAPLLGQHQPVMDILSSITIPARQHPAFSGVTIKRTRLDGPNVGGGLTAGSALAATAAATMPLAPPMMPMPPVALSRPDLALQQTLAALRARQRAAAPTASALTAPSASIEPFQGLSMRRTRSQGPPELVPNSAPSTLAPPALPMSTFGGLSGLPMVSGLSGLVADGLEALEEQLPLEGDPPLLGSPMRRIRSRGLPAASGLGDAAADGFEALVAPAPSDPPPPDAPLLGSPMRRTRSRGLAPLPLTSSITDLVSSFMA